MTDSPANDRDSIYAKLDALAEGARRTYYKPEMYLEWIDDYTEQMLKIVAQAERKARKDQIMRDSLEFSMFTGVDEAEIIDWREDSLAELQRESDVT